MRRSGRAMIVVTGAEQDWSVRRGEVAWAEHERRARGADISGRSAAFVMRARKASAASHGARQQLPHRPHRHSCTGRQARARQMGGHGPACRGRRLEDRVPSWLGAGAHYKDILRTATCRNSASRRSPPLKGKSVGVDRSAGRAGHVGGRSGGHLGSGLGHVPGRSELGLGRAVVPWAPGVARPGNRSPREE